MTLPYYVSESQTHPLYPILSSLSHFLYEYCFTLPYLSFPASPSVMPINPVLLTSIISGLLSDPSRLSLYVHNTFRTWIVLCSLFVQTSNYISRTTPVYFLSLNLDLSSTYATPQVTFQAPAKLRVQRAASFSLPARLGLAYYPPLYHFCLFIHIPVPDPVPPCVSCFQYSFVSCSPSPIPVPFHFASHSSCSNSVSLIVSNPMPFSHDPDMFSSILIRSELHVCFLSLKLT